MRAGELRHRVTIQTLGDTTQNAYGESQGSWSSGRTVYASVQPVGGSEIEELGRMVPIMNHLVRMRYQPDVTLTPKNRLLWGTRELNITSVLKTDEVSEEWRITCTERIA